MDDDHDERGAFYGSVPGTRRVPMAAAATTKRIRCCTCVSCVGTNEYSTVQQYSSMLYANPQIVRVQDRSLIIVTDKLEEGRALVPNIACKTKAIGGEVSVGSCNEWQFEHTLPCGMVSEPSKTRAPEHHHLVQHVTNQQR